MAATTDQVRAMLTPSPIERLVATGDRLAQLVGARPFHSEAEFDRLLGEIVNDRREDRWRVTIAGEEPHEPFGCYDEDEGFEPAWGAA